jgi:hypothetical protein
MIVTRDGELNMDRQSLTKIIVNNSLTDLYTEENTV